MPLCQAGYGHFLVNLNFGKQHLLLQLTLTQGRQSWSPYYGSRRSMRRYEKSQHGEDPRSVTVEEVVSTIDVDCEFDEGNGNTFVRSFSKPATADGVNKQLQRSNSLSTKKLKNIFVFGNSSKLGEERQKGVVLFSATSFAQDIDDGISGTENVAYVPDDLVQDQEFGESMNTGHIAKADEVKSMLEILSKGKREPRTLSGKENITKLSLKRAPVQIPGIKCGILEYPYAYITHSIVHKDNMRDLI